MNVATTQRPRRLVIGPLSVVLLGTGLLCVALVLWAFAGPLSGSRMIGDGSDPTTYGFDLSAQRFDGGHLAASGHARDFLVALDEPEVKGGVEIALANRAGRYKEIVSTDRVVGVVIGDEARAYPLSLLNAHEIVNDTLGGMAIAVTFSPLADAPVVVDRRIDDRVARFRVSGLVLDSTLLMYDADEPADAPSLWSPLRGMAVSGAAAAAEQALTRIPNIQLVAWRDWLATHPTTTLVQRDPTASGRYRKIDYKRYLDGPGPILPFGRDLPDDGLGAMAPVVVVRRDGHVIAHSVDALLERGGRVESTLGDASISFLPDTATRTVRVEAPAGTLVLHGLWFALHGMDPSLASDLDGVSSREMGPGVGAEMVR